MPQSKEFNHLVLQKKIIKFITTSRLPFRIIEHPEFKDLLEYTKLAKSGLHLPSARSIRRLLDDEVHKNQQSVLDKLPKESCLSIALDCWTSPFAQAFMAVTGYFLDSDWNYCEVLLGFEHLQGSYTGAYLSERVIKILKGHGIADRVLSVVTDNASNNNTMILRVQDVVQSQALCDISILRVPCIVHVLQLSLKDLLGNIRACLVNEEAGSEWSGACTESLQTTSRQPSKDIIATLKKVSLA